MKRCPKCGETKPRGEFYTGYCKPCTKADVRRWQKENPEQFRRTQRRSALKRKYGLTESDFTEMLASQLGKCAICQTDLTEGSADIDHCHKTGKVRGLLCNRCNRTIGLFGDDATRIRAAAQYLKAIR